MPRVILDAAHGRELLADLEMASRDFIDHMECAPELWLRARPGKWNGGQHAEHLVLVHALTADAFEAAAQTLAAGRLRPRPRRGLLQKLVVHLLAQRSKFPRGGKTIAAAAPVDAPDRSATLARLRGEVARYRSLVELHTNEQLDQLWIKNPFVKFDWHYALPEMLRIHAQHTRHHLMLAEENRRS